MIKEAYEKGSVDAVAAVAKIADLDEVKLASFLDAAKQKLSGAGKFIADKAAAGKKAAGDFYAGKGATAVGPHADEAAAAAALAAAEKKKRLQRILGTAAAGGAAAGGGAALALGDD